MACGSATLTCQLVEGASNEDRQLLSSAAVRKPIGLQQLNATVLFVGRPACDISGLSSESGRCGLHGEWTPSPNSQTFQLELVESFCVTILHYTCKSGEKVIIEQ